MPIAPDNSTLATEISKLFLNASRADGLEKNRMYGSIENWPPTTKLFTKVNRFGYRMPTRSTKKIIKGIMSLSEEISPPGQTELSKLQNTIQARLVPSF